MHVMISKWAPPSERSVLTSIAYSGTSLGMVIGTLLSGTIAQYLGWQWIFYIEGALCLIWCTAWWLMIEDSPEKQQWFISEAEKNYIPNSLGEIKGHHAEKLAVPWGQIFKSPPFIAILVSHFCSNFGLYLILTKMPTIMKQLLDFDLHMVCSYFLIFKKFNLLKYWAELISFAEYYIDGFRITLYVVLYSNNEQDPVGCDR